MPQASILLVAMRHRHMTERDALIQRLVHAILASRRGTILRVAIDGVDGVGKTTLTDDLGLAPLHRGSAAGRTAAGAGALPRAPL